MAAGWERLASVTLGSNSATLSSGTFTAKKHLIIEWFGIKSGGSGDSKLRWNGDTGSNYTRRQNTNGGSDSTGTSQDMHDNMVGDGGSGDFHAVAHVLNVATTDKIIICEAVNNGTAGAGTAPSRRESVMKWANTSAQITSCELSISGGDTYNTGSTVTVWGADDAALVYPNTPNGTIYEESDTGKHYMFDGTSAWNEM